MNLKTGLAKLSLLAALAVAASAGAQQKQVTDEQAARNYFTDLPVLSQNGKQMRFYSDVLKDNVVLINFVFTNCRDACPQITQQLTPVREQLANEFGKDLHFVSINLDPERDMPAALREFARNQKAEHEGWLFVTGDVDKVNHIIKKLGQYTPDIEAHSVLMLAGNVKYGHWAKIPPAAQPMQIAEKLRQLADESQVRAVKHMPAQARFGSRITAAPLVGLLGIGAAKAQNSGFAATVNGEGIARERLDSSVDAYFRKGGMNYVGITQPGQFRRAQREVLEQLVSQELLRQQAEQSGCVASSEEIELALDSVHRGYPDELVFKNDLTEKGYTPDFFREDLLHKVSVRKWARAMLVPAIEVSHAEVHDFYVTNQGRFIAPEQINVRHLLIKVDRNADDAVLAVAQLQIERVLQLAQEGADFAELARQYSQDTTASRGGEFAFTSRGQLVRSFEDAAYALQPGGISGVVRTRFGLHIIQLIARRDGALIPEQQVAEPIRSHLFENKLVEVVAKRVSSLREQAAVEILIPLEAGRFQWRKRATARYRRHG
jgi:parvulin-like peptidyl-prolyl isomerase/cytochrome oxidase Cu insertion factor (SCO1/SenC/PrrC family)